VRAQDGAQSKDIIPLRNFVANLQLCLLNARPEAPQRRKGVQPGPRDSAPLTLTLTV
jgi:hypothetical protein